MKKQATPPSPPDWEPDAGRALDLVMELMAVPGPSGQESAVARVITGRLAEAGVAPGSVQFDKANRRTPIAGETGNLVVKLPGTARGPRRMLSAHLDTVPICVGSQPARRGDRIYSRNPDSGLGADNRAGCAVLLNTVLDITARRLPHPPLTFCWFVQEENGIQGARTASLGLWGKPRLSFNWDGGSPTKLTIGATGGYRMVIRIEGIASHAGGAPQDGVSAIAIAGLAIARLEQEGWHGLVQKDGRQGTSNIGVIRGGAATNVVTDRVEVRAEARSHDPVFRRRILKRIEKAFQDAARQVRNQAGRRGKVLIESRLDYEAYLLDRDEPCVAAAEAAVRAIGHEPEHAVANGGVDSNWITAHGIPSVSLGCGQRNAHMLDEQLDVPDFQNACRIALRLATASEQVAESNEVHG